MQWETKDVLMLMVAIGGFAAAFGVAQSKVANLTQQLADFKAVISAELRELKRDTATSFKSQGERLGELELASRLQREIARAAGRGTPAMGTLLAAARGQRSGQVQQAVDDGNSSDDDERGR